MFDEMSLEPEEGRKVDWTVARTIIQFAVSFGVIGAIVWVLKKIYPQSTLINKIFNFGTPIAILILLIVCYIGYQMSKGFKQYCSKIKRFTSGGAAYDGLNIVDIVDDLLPRKNIFSRLFKRLKK